MNNINYVTGDATNPLGDGKKFILHIVNDLGVWGSGFVIAVSNKWPKAKTEYQNWKKQNNGLALGTIQTVVVEKDIVVINMVGQRDIRTLNGVPPVRYGAIKKCLSKVADLALKYKASIHAPRFGSERAGGDWKQIEKLIQDELCSKDIDVTIYDLPGTTPIVTSPPKTISNITDVIDPMTGIFDE